MWLAKTQFAVKMLMMVIMIHDDDDEAENERRMKPFPRLNRHHQLNVFVAIFSAKDGLNIIINLMLTNDRVAILLIDVFFFFSSYSLSRALFYHYLRQMPCHVMMWCCFWCMQLPPRCNRKSKIIVAIIPWDSSSWLSNWLHYVHFRALRSPQRSPGFFYCTSTI